MRQRPKGLQHLTGKAYDAIAKAIREGEAPPNPPKPAPRRKKTPTVRQPVQPRPS